MRCFFAMLAFMAFAVPSYAFTININAPQNVETGDTFALTADVVNDYSAAAGSDTSPLIATLLSSNNCIINSAKILGTFHAGERKQASWVITAPGAGVCVFSVSVGTFTRIYAQQNAAVSVIPQKGSASSSAAGGGMGGGTDGKNIASVAENATSETMTNETPSPDTSDVTGGDEDSEVTSPPETLEIDAEDLLPYASVVIVIAATTIAVAAYRSRKKRDPWSR